MKMKRWEDIWRKRKKEEKEYERVKEKGKIVWSRKRC
jgi:hypothetical protein